MNNEDARIEIAREHVTSLLCRLGIKKATQAIGITRATLTALLAGCQVRRGTIAMVLEHQRLEAEGPSSDAQGAA